MKQVGNATEIRELERCDEVNAEPPPGAPPRLISGLLTAALLTGCATPLVLEAPWIEVKSMNFTIYAELDEAEAQGRCIERS